MIGAADDLYVAAHELDGEASDFDLTDRDIEDFVETQAENFLRVGTKAAGIAYSLNFLIRHHGYPAVMKCKLQNSVSYFWYCSMSYFLNYFAWGSAICGREPMKKYDTKLSYLHAWRCIFRLG